MRARPDNGARPGDIAVTLSALEDKLRALELELSNVEQEEARLSSPDQAPAAPSPLSALPAAPPVAAAPPSRSAVPAPPDAHAPPPNQSLPDPPPSSLELAGAVAEARERLFALRAQVSELLRFRDELRTSAQDLIADYQTVIGQNAAPRVVLDAGPFADIGPLASFEQALRGIPDLGDVRVRSFQGGRAELELTLDRPMPLVERIRAVVDRPVRVTGATPDRLTIELEASPSR